MQRRYLYLTAGLAAIAAVGLIADRTTQVRKYVLPDHITSDGKMVLPNGWRITPAGRHIKLPGDLPMKMIVTADSKLIVNTAGYAALGITGLGVVALLVAMIMTRRRQLPVTA